jgi:hypothetical protein
MAIAWGALALAGADGESGRVLDTLAMPTELGALAGAVLVGWITSTNERRERVLVDKAAELERRVGADGATIGDLRRAALALRARNDRLDLSLTFLRNIAHRLHGSDPEAAAQAALELITARIGARAASVQMSDGGALRPLAVVGIWNHGAPDRTALAVLGGGQPMRALELAEGGPGDSDIAAPIVDGLGGVRGIVAARGVPGGGSSMAALRDLAVIADWASPVLCNALGRAPDQDAVDESDERKKEAAASANEPEPDADRDDEAGEGEESEPAPLTISPAHA